MKMDWKDLIDDLRNLNFDDVLKEIGDYSVYRKSLVKKNGSFLFMARIEGEKKLIIVRESEVFERFNGREKNIGGIKVKIASLTAENAGILREEIPFTSPVPFGREGLSMGLGDRLGIAGPGHVETVRKREVRPVLAQQSIRELELTGRTYRDVLDSASWAVFQEGYKKGFGADGDHLKTEEDIKRALNLGFSMLTLDCSEHIDNSVNELSPEEIREKYNGLNVEIKEELEEIYLNKTFILASGEEISFDRRNFPEIVLTYHGMLGFTVDIYDKLVKPLQREIDFEVSIDETETPTTPAAHYFVANELKRAGIKTSSLAPRFCGEFQKGIDYIGNLEQFEEEFRIHAEIADRFGYKLSIHSGSDKFSIFPIIGKYTGGRVHVKTAGTNWLEAMRIVAEQAPSLYREIHQFALDKFREATRYYHVTTDIANIPSLAVMTDEELPQLFEHDDARQLIHITYGLILQAKDEKGYIFRDRLYQLWQENEDEYRGALQEHIGNHIKKLKSKL